jgi:hypothetical protein
VLIPHQHTNVHNRVTSVDRPVRNIGYTGHWRNLGVANQQLFDHIAAWGEPRGIAFKTIEYFQYKNVGKGVADVYKQVRHCACAYTCASVVTESTRCHLSVISVISLSLSFPFRKHISWACAFASARCCCGPTHNAV